MNTNSPPMTPGKNKFVKYFCFALLVKYINIKIIQRKTQNPSCFNPYRTIKMS